VKRLAILALVLALASCKKSDNNAAPPPAGSGSAPAMGSGSAAPAMGSGSAAVTPPPAAAQADVPTEQDFEGQAQKDIDDKNVEAKVKSIEQDLGGAQ